MAIDVRVQSNQMSTIFLKDETYASRDDDWVCSSTHTRLPRKLFISGVRKEQFRAYIYIGCESVYVAVTVRIQNLLQAKKTPKSQ